MTAELIPTWFVDICAVTGAVSYALFACIAVACSLGTVRRRIRERSRPIARRRLVADAERAIREDAA